MRGRLCLLLLLVCACKAQLGDPNNQGDDAPPTDAQDDAPGEVDDAPPDGTQPLGPWSAPAPVLGASTGTPEDDGTLSSTTLELVFSYEDPADDDRKHLYYMSRPSPQQPWTTPGRLPFFVPDTTDQTPRFSADDLTLYFASDRPGTAGALDIWQVSRPSIGGTWGTPSRVPGVNSGSTDKWWMPCTGDRYLMISSRDGNGEDVYEGVLGQGAPARSAQLSSNSGETGSFLTGDCLTAYFASSRSGDNRIYIATRTSPTAPWTAPAIVTEFMPVAGDDQEDPWLSSDGRTFMLSSNKNGNKDVYLSTR